MSSDDITDEKRQQMEANAEPAEEDLEELLVRLMDMSSARRKDPVLERNYETIRNYVSRILAREGPKYFVDRDGYKHYAVAVVPEPVEVNVNRLIAMAQNGEISWETLDAVAPRKVSAEAFRRATHTGRITSEQLVEVAKIKKGTAHVDFSDPLE